MSGPAAKTMDFLKEQKLGLGVGLALGLASMGGAWFGTKQRKKDKDAMIAEARKQICLMEDGSTLDFDELQACASLSHTDLTPAPCFACTSFLCPLCLSFLLASFLCVGPMRACGRHEHWLVLPMNSSPALSHV